MTELAPGTGSGPVVVGYDGTPAAEHALRAAAPLLAGQPILVTVVWEAGRAFELTTLPTVDLGAPPGPLDVETALEIDQAMHEQAERLADKGVGIAREVGLVAGRLVVPQEANAADTLLRVAAERDARAVVVGAHGRGRLSDLLLGSTSRHLVKHAPCPVVVVRHP